MLPPTPPVPIIWELMLLIGPGDEENPPSPGWVDTTEDRWDEERWEEDRWGFTGLFMFMLSPHGKVLELRGDGTLVAQFW